MEKRLTEYSACGGCASKLAAGELARMLGDIPLIDDDRVLVDYRTADDAGVYKWPGGPALVQTVDFFTPVVDDPYAYGKIAAANALSDVYAMGGVPRTALAIAALPDAGPGADVIKRIFRGGFDTLREAGVALLGGHTVRDQEIKFGYAITGEIDPARVLTNAGARVGDVLILTKALGTGIINTAVKFNRATEAQAASAIASMCQLNRASAEILRALPPQVISACTDVTGFSLVGHASEMAAGSHVTLEIRAEHVPLLEGAGSVGRKKSSGRRPNQSGPFRPAGDLWSERRSGAPARHVRSADVGGPINRRFAWGSGRSSWAIASIGCSRGRNRPCAGSRSCWNPGPYQVSWLPQALPWELAIASPALAGYRREWYKWSFR